MSLWRQIQKQNFTDWKKLSAFLQIGDAPFLKNSDFPLNLPLRLAQKIKKNTLDDPILRQFLPIKEEVQNVPGFHLDPVGDLPSRKEKKLLHKYKGRALLICTSACAMNCRFCFRRNFSYETTEKSFDAELAFIRKDRSISEVILSGGDPLSLSNQFLKELIFHLNEIPHLKKLRFHTRFPIGIPERVEAEFLDILKSTSLQVIFIIHCNHSNELDTEVLAALKKIRLLGIPTLSQTVLLKGVNDSVSILKDLMEKLTNNGILPYYLHQLDRVQGAAHFEVSEETGLALLEQLSSELPGYALPRYVKEIAGEASKTTLHPIKSFEP